MAQEILNVSQLKVGVEDKEILHGVDLSLNKGETHVLMGPNGAGKSTLGYALMGNPRYEILGGKVTFNGEDLLSKNVAERSQAGLFLSFQNPIEVPGITLGNFYKKFYGAAWKEDDILQVQEAPSGEDGIPSDGSIIYGQRP